MARRFHMGIESLEVRSMLASNITSTFASGVLSVKGTEGRDYIIIAPNEQGIGIQGVAINDGTAEAKAGIPASAIKQVKIEALGGDDYLEISDQVKGGFSLSVNGGSGADVIVAPAGAKLDGDKADTVANYTDLNVDKFKKAAVYLAKTSFDLEHKFRDQYGYAVEIEGGEAKGQGDATLRTALAAISSALASYKASGAALDAANADTKSFLDTITKHSWDATTGDPIRHPTERMTSKDGRDLGHSPLSKDSFGAIVAAAYYAYSSPNSTAAVRDSARQLIGMFVTYLPAHQWRLTSKFTEDQINNNVQGMKKGPETFLLIPTEIDALKNVAAKMGFATVGWSPWAGLGSGISATVGDYLGNYLAHGLKIGPDGAIAAAGLLGPEFAATSLFAEFLNRGGLEGILNQVKFSYNQDVNLGGWAKPIHIGVDIELPKAARDAILNAFQGIIRSAVTSGSSALNMGDVAGSIVDKVLSSLPKVFGADQWKSALTGTLQSVLPWLDGSNLTTAATFIFSTEALRYQYGNDKGAMTLVDGLALAVTTGLTGVPVPLTKGEQNDSSNWYNVHMGFWPTLLIEETRPEMVEILQPFVKLFERSIKADEMGLWDWLAKDQTKVNDLVGRFQAGEFERLGDAWERSAEQKTADLRLMPWGDGSGVPTSGKNLVIVGVDKAGQLHIKIFKDDGKLDVDVVEGNFTTQAGAIAALKQQLTALSARVPTATERFQVIAKVATILGRTDYAPRIDYLILKGLSEKGTPASLKVTIGNWGAHWSRILKDIGGKLADVVKAGIAKTGRYIREAVDAAGQLVRETWDKAGNYVNARIKDGKVLFEKTYNVAGDLVNNKFIDSGGHWVSQTLDKAGNVIKEWLYFDGAGKSLQKFRTWSGGKLTSLQQYNAAGWKEIDKFIDSGGHWVSQTLDKAGNVIKEWLYFDGAGKSLQKFRAWSGGKLINLDKYTSAGVRTLQAYVSTTGNWVERVSRDDGVETAVRVWNKAGVYLGDQLKNFRDAASKLDPTTKDWWPF
jgi:hypothetical protein